ncbi:MAG: F-type H+-transporting ATPase subunit gamma [Frankiaceae bacterium]|jgi:F-type H+-transporting ATPase subunit gamma|nr:F-type H+-transporting ATPase subunit gamma [Frankiaceae bacterium]
MGAAQRVFRRRIKSVQSTKKITRAMELIAASRVVKAQQRVAATLPYADALTNAVSAVATATEVDHPLTTENANPTRAALLVVTSDRGLAGGYSAFVLRTAESYIARLRDEGKETKLYVIGRKGGAYFRFRNRPIEELWTGFTDSPTYTDAKVAADTLIDAFRLGTDEGGVDEIHIVFTEFISSVTQRPTVSRILPLVVEEREYDPAAEKLPFPLYEFEPSPEAVLDALLPKYVTSRIFNALLQAAASEHAARRRAMKSATDNAEDLIKDLVRKANSARQAEITQEIMEIVGGVEALSKAGGSD